MFADHQLDRKANSKNQDAHEKLRSLKNTAYGILTV